MNFLFYCQGDDGRMLNAFSQALADTENSHKLINAHDSSQPIKRDSIDAAIVWLPPDDFFEGLTKLTHVYVLAAGVDQLLKHKSLPEHVHLVRLEDAGMAPQMQEYVLYGVLRAQRRFHQFDAAQSKSEWLRGVPIIQASDTRVGVLGAGVLATAVAQRLVLNGYPTTCWSRTPKQPSGGIEHVDGNAALPEFLSRSDVLVCLLPLTDLTHGILNTGLFYQLPKGAFIINCARGQHLVDVDLLNALDDQHISGAMLDVFHHEPLPQNHPFWSHPKIVITPHEAASTPASEAIKQIMRSIEQVELGEKPSGLVDRSAGY